MNVMIFAAGLGTRLKPFTDQHPKALAPVAGIPALGRNLQMICNITAAKIDKVVINIHHFPEQIRQYIAHNDFGLPIEFSDESELLLDTGGGLLKAAPLLTDGLSDDTLLLINADILTDIPLDDIIREHIATKADVTLLCADRKSSRTLWFDQNNQLIGWENLTTGETKPMGFASNDKDGETSSPFCGIHILKASKVLPAINDWKQKSVFSIVPFYLSQLNNLDIKRYLLPDANHWFDIGTSEKLEAANKFFFHEYK